MYQPFIPPYLGSPMSYAHPETDKLAKAQAKYAKALAKAYPVAAIAPTTSYQLAGSPMGGVLDSAQRSAIMKAAWAKKKAKMTPEEWAAFRAKRAEIVGPLSPEHKLALREGLKKWRESLTPEMKASKKASKSAKMKSLMTPERMAKLQEGRVKYQALSKEEKRAKRAAKFSKKFNKLVPPGAGLLSARGLIEARGGKMCGGAIGLASLASMAIPLIVKGISALVKRGMERRKAKKVASAGELEGIWTHRMKGEVARNTPQFWRRVYSLAHKQIPLYFKDRATADKMAQEFLLQHGYAFMGKVHKKIMEERDKTEKRPVTVADFFAPVITSVAEEKGKPEEAEKIMAAAPMQAQASGSGLAEDLLSIARSPETKAIMKSVASTVWPAVVSRVKRFVKGKLLKTKLGKKIYKVGKTAKKFTEDVMTQLPSSTVPKGETADVGQMTPPLTEILPGAPQTVPKTLAPPPAQELIASGYGISSASRYSGGRKTAYSVMSMAKKT